MAIRRVTPTDVLTLTDRILTQVEETSAVELAGVTEGAGGGMVV
jgi:hypothetical protein